jgi:putative DNA primase/helicase
MAGATMTTDSQKLPAPSIPLQVARKFVGDIFTDPATTALTLRHWRGAWWKWETTRWAEIERGAVRAAAYKYTEYAVYENDDGKLAVWAPNRHKIANLMEAVAAVVHLPATVVSPSWLDRRKTGVVVSCANGILDVRDRTLSPHTPMLFNMVAVPFDYDPDQRAAYRWNDFLVDLWPDDRASINALGEWFGYVLSGRTTMQKILLIVGPTRGGKGAIVPCTPASC